MKKYKMYIGGDWVGAASNEMIDSYNPFTGKVWAQVPRGDSVDADRAVAAAQAGFSEWSSWTPTRRGKVLVAFSELLEKEAGHLAKVETQDNGKLIAEMSAQLKYIPEWYRYFGGMADKVEGSVPPIDKADHFCYTQHEPLGVIVAITAWNSPLLLAAWKLAAALAAGNAVILKPSEYASVSSLEFAKVVEKADFPPGVINVVTGYGNEVGEPLVGHPDVGKVTFTGGNAGGQAVYQRAAREFKPVTLELGGKSPNIVFDDANFDNAVKGAISGIFAATGQTCIAGSRLLVQRGIHDRFVEAVVEMAKSAKMGDPSSMETQVGPITTKPQHDKVLKYIDVARGEGAMCVLGGNAVEGKGWFVQPTIFTGVHNKMRIAQEEVFGPVLSVIPFDDEAEAIEIANDIKFGLAAGVWTQDMGRAFRMAKAIKAGTVWINTYRAVSYVAPFGGFKQSGFGRESGLAAIYEFLQSKCVWISTQKEVPDPFIMRT